MGGRVRDKVKVYGYVAFLNSLFPFLSFSVLTIFLRHRWIGGDRPTDILEQAKKRKAEGFTTVKMNGSESVSLLFVHDSLSDASSWS